jgi:hypothetical protein
MQEFLPSGSLTRLWIWGSILTRFGSRIDLDRRRGLSFDKQNCLPFLEEIWLKYITHGMVVNCTYCKKKKKLGIKAE